MANDGPDDSPVSGDATAGHGGEIDRRRLIRGASLVAGGALVGIAANPGKADANTGDPWILGIPSSAQAPTEVSLLANIGRALVVESSGFGPVVSSKASGGANIGLFGATDGLDYPDDPNGPGAVGFAGVLGLANV